MTNSNRISHWRDAAVEGAEKAKDTAAGLAQQSLCQGKVWLQRAGQFLGERPFQPRHVPRFVNQPATRHLAHLVDGVSELIAAVFDVDCCLGVREIATVDVSDA